MRVLVLTNLFPNAAEPTRATFNARQFRELSKTNELTIVAPVSWVNRRYLLRKSGDAIPYFETLFDLPTYHPTYWYIPRILRSLHGFFFFLSALRTLRRVIKKRRPDVILASWAYPDGFAGILAGRLFDLPVVIKVHGSDIHSVVGRLRRKLTAFALKRAQGVISVSKDLASGVEAMGVASKSIEVVYNGVDLSSATREVSVAENGLSAVLFVGNLVPIKNIDILLQAFSNLDRLELKIVGDGPLAGQLAEQASRLGVADRISFLGTRPHKDIPALMCSARLLVLPSQNEGVPNVVLEAMASGLPVVASRVGGIPEVLPDYAGILVEPGDALALRNGIEEALSKSWDSEAIKRSASRFKWTTNARSVTKILEKAAHK